MGNRIKELRQSKGISQSELAQKVGISNQAISHYETEKRYPKIEAWQKLADFFNVSVPYLQGFDVSESKHKSEIDTEQLEKLIALAILFSFPEMTLTYGNIELDDDHKPFIVVGILSQILNKLGYEPKEKFQEVYIKAMNLAEDQITRSHLAAFKTAVDKAMPKFQGMTSNLLRSYKRL